MGARFIDAPERVRLIARDIIEENHPHLIEAKIKYLFREALSWESKGKTILGSARLVVPKADGEFAFRPQSKVSAARVFTAAIVGKMMRVKGIVLPAKLAAEWDSELQAWGELQRVVQRYGYYRQQEALAALSPKTAAVVQQFGWETICMTPMDDIPTLRAQFTRAFQALAERQKQNELLPPAMRKSIASERLRLASEAENKAREAG